MRRTPIDSRRLILTGGAAVAFTGLVASGCGLPGPAATSTVAVAETCVSRSGQTTTRSTEVTTKVDHVTLTTGNPITLTIDLADYDQGQLIAASATVDIVFPLPQTIDDVTAVAVAASPVSARWSATVEGHTVHLAYRHPVKQAATFAGVPPVVIKAMARSSINHPGMPSPLPVWSSYETSFTEQGNQWGERCIPDDPNQPLISFTVNNPPY